MNTIALQGLEELSTLRIAEVEDDLSKLALDINKMLKDEERLKGMGTNALNFFDRYLAPTVYAKNVYNNVVQKSLVGGLKRI